jgi:hypothetical protein
MNKISVILAALALTSGAARAQGALSLQGLGYPAGGISTRAEGAGSSLADFDALSVTSPASIAGVGASALYFQYSPEFRRVTTPGGTAKTTTARFPVVLGILPMGQSWTLGLSSSTFLDRSLQTSLSRTEVVGDATDTVTVTEQNKVLGAINDVRLALAWSGGSVLRIGVGGHVFSGSHRITLSSIYPDSSKYISTSQSGRLSYAGFAASIGVEIHPSRTIGLALVARKGGDLRAQSNDSTIGTGRVPDHYSGSIAFTGLPGTMISARLAHDGWSSLGSLSATGIRAYDGWDGGVGIEATGPRFLQRIITVRAGARFRTLPFGLPDQPILTFQDCNVVSFCTDTQVASPSHKVSEKSFAFGFGIPLTRDQAALDLSFAHATRDAGTDVKERGFIMSFGLRVSP